MGRHTNIAQGEQENSTADGLSSHQGETTKIKDWVDKGEKIEQDVSSPQFEKETATLERAIVVRSGPEQPAQQTMTYTGRGALSISAQHCMGSCIQYYGNFDEWMHFRTVVRLRDVSSFEDLTKIEDQFLLLAETEQVAELMQRKSMLMYKLYEMEVQKLVDDHLANFKLDVPSVNHDYLCIRSLNKELKEIAKQHRDQCVLAGLLIVAPEASFVQSMDSIFGSMDSKIEQLLNVQTFMKHEFGAYRRAFFDNMDTVAGNVNSSQTSLETTVLHHLIEHQLQLASDLEYVKFQLAELVNHLKEAGDAKKGEGGKSGSRLGEGSGRQGEGPSSTRETRSEQSQAGQGKTSSQHSGTLVTDKPSKVNLVKLVKVKPAQDIKVCWFWTNQLGTKPCRYQFKDV
ncbi:hypothetical protein F511_38950 [Dorcoceras hygrometricum]|uniref:Uncharacterized protein n=1 Tax=Dorcoceras hygrometricum TaxID=472368 RepID=A0A2Z7DHZ7_9LAMI|nr:hypothetical protein F511_38950 [Dorcoceras hygrometricum]